MGVHKHSVHHRAQGNKPSAAVASQLEQTFNCEGSRSLWAQHLGLCPESYSDSLSLSSLRSCLAFVRLHPRRRRLALEPCAGWGRSPSMLLTATNPTHFPLFPLSQLLVVSGLSHLYLLPPPHLPPPMALLMAVITFGWTLLTL